MPSIVEVKNVIYSNKLDELVEETYGRPFSYQQQEGGRLRAGIREIVVPNNVEDFDRDTIPEELNGSVMGVSFAAWLARDPKAPVGTDTSEWVIRMFWERNFYPDDGIVLNDLHARGLLPAGNYLLIVDW